MFVCICFVCLVFVVGQVIGRRLKQFIAFSPNAEFSQIPEVIAYVYICAYICTHLHMRTYSCECPCLSLSRSRCLIRWRRLHEQIHLWVQALMRTLKTTQVTLHMFLRINKFKYTILRTFQLLRGAELPASDRHRPWKCVCYKFVTVACFAPSALPEANLTQFYFPQDLCVELLND